MHASMFFPGLVAVLSLLCQQVAAQDRQVYAHFIIGVAASLTPDDWTSNINSAVAAGIDGFALNLGNDGGDGYSLQQLGYAYSAAESQGSFKMFISFDYNEFGWTADQIIGIINDHSSSSAQAMYNNQPLVSTFEGPNSSGDWPGIKSATSCFFMPDWTSQKSNTGLFDVVDGALSWDIWPTGANNMTSEGDVAWQNLLGSKPYMMGVSPWFYTHIDAATYSKDWIVRGAGLWHERWQEVFAIGPQLVEIATWNDFGESHYIGPLCPNCFPTGNPGSDDYCANNPHDAWQLLLPTYISQYKTGTASIPGDLLVWAHQPNPSTGTSCQDGGATDLNDQTDGLTASQIALDVIDVYVLLTAPASLSVSIGGGTPFTQDLQAGMQYVQVPFNGQTGQVTYTVSRADSGTVLSGTENGIVTDCTALGYVNWNAVTGSISP